MYNRGTERAESREPRLFPSKPLAKRLMRVPRKNAPSSKTSRRPGSSRVVLRSDVYLSLVLGTGCWKALVE